MAYEEKSMAHSLVLEERQRLSMTGVEEVVSFDETQVSVRTVKGLVTLRGSALRVEALEKDTGALTITGTINDLCYEDTASGAGFWSRLWR